MLNIFGDQHASCTTIKKAKHYLKSKTLTVGDDIHPAEWISVFTSKIISLIVLDDALWSWIKQWSTFTIQKLKKWMESQQ